MKKLALLIGLFAFLILAGTARADNVWTCNSCVDCNSYLENTINDIIQLTQNITSSGSCIGFTLAGTGNTFDCQGYTITGTGSGGIAILISEQDSKIKNCNINGSFAYGIYDDGNTGVLIDNVRINNASTAGIYLSGNNAIMNNSVLWGNAIGINISSTGNTFYNNMLNNTVNYYNTTSSSNNWNTTITNGTNIVGGSQIGGNYWANPSGTGYSQTCTNANNDSFCDSAYSFNPTDYLPLTLNSPKTYTCDSCSSCSSMLNNGTVGDGDTLQIVNDFGSGDYDFEDCILLKSNQNVTIDLNGHILSSWAADTSGCAISGNAAVCSGFAFGSAVGNVTIKNGKISGNWISGITFDGANNLVVDNITFDMQLSYDAGQINLIDVNQGTIKNNIFKGMSCNDRYAVSFSGSNNSIFINNSFTGSDSCSLYALRFSVPLFIVNRNSYNNTFTQNIFNQIYLLDLDKSINSSFYDNIFNSSSGYLSGGTPDSSNTWNTTATAGTNIVGGSQIGGNYWANPSGTGYSQTCTNANNDSFCDVAYSFNLTDYLPLTLNYPKTYTCNSCASCTANISASSAGDTILVTSNFTSYEEFDICVDTKAGIIFDCQGYWIDDGFMTLFGIWLHSNSVTVRNCNFRNFQIAGLPIYVEGYNNTLDNIYTADNGNGVSGAGIYIAASNSTFNNIRSTNNDYGIWLRSSPGNIISNSTIWGNTYGIFVDVSISNNTFYNNFLNNTVNYRNTTSTGTNYWNTTITTGTNIIGGSQIGGNYWAYPNGTGYSETCNVTVIDGICDDSFSLDGSNTDYLPLSFASAPAPPLPAELSGMALTLSDAGTGLGGFLGAITDPIVGFVLLLGIVSGMFMIFYGLAKAITFTLSQVAG
jgi:parallel beta-helix repeat protein